MDDELLTELGEAVRAAQQVPSSFIAAGKAAFAWRTVDSDLAELSNDSLSGTTSGTRAERAEIRALTFVSGELTIEVEVTDEALVGQIVPAQTGTIEWEGPKGRSGMVPVDEVGWFAIRPTPSGPVRLHLRTGSGHTVRTEWITL